MTKRNPLTTDELEALPLHSVLQESIVNFLVKYKGSLNRQATFELEDGLLASLKPRDSRSDFVELAVLSPGAPRLIRAVEAAWLNARVMMDPFQNPESLGVNLSLIIHEDAASWPSIANTILDGHGRAIDPLRKGDAPE